jgi:hypothetical protein
LRHRPGPSRVEPPAPAHAVGLNITPGRLLIEAATLRQILGLAYAIQRVRVLDGPSWTDTEPYTIAAKTESADLTREQVRAMLQALIADRFKVSLRRESREISMYRLVRIKDATALRLAKDGDNTEVIVGGSYDFSLETVTAAGEVVSPFTAVQEQLGLKLEPTKAQMEVLVIDHAERPTPN